MRRTPPWVFVAAAGIEPAVLLLCVWGMERSPFADVGKHARLAPQPERQPARRDGAIEARFTGGGRDFETIALQPLVGWSLA